MRYRGYQSIIRFSELDDCFYGKIEGLEDLISFEGRSVDELKAAFREAVDDYLEICRAAGKSPERPYKGSFNVRVDPELHRRAALQSARLGISLNQLIRTALEREVGARGGTE